ncbi:MAG TPA: EutN/CcmL family microcompartment protein [Acidobacteriota bacterium]|nr:EutN/CcmL family microcompartment protein [Acidobacteriota bacterium]
MTLGRVLGTVVATQKNPKYEGAKLLIVQPLDLRDKPMGEPLIAIDAVGAGVGEKVLVVQEGRAANEALHKTQGPMDSAIVGIVDVVDLA